MELADSSNTGVLVSNPDIQENYYVSQCDIQDMHIMSWDENHLNVISSRNGSLQVKEAERLNGRHVSRHKFGTGEFNQSNESNTHLIAKSSHTSSEDNSSYIRTQTAIENAENKSTKIQVCHEQVLTIETVWNVPRSITKVLEHDKHLEQFADISTELEERPRSMMP
jgi:hypothetical protein